MSKPGFPINMEETRTVHSNYHVAMSGVDLPGSDTCSIRFHNEDKDGANTPGWPVNVQTNDYLRYTASWKQEPLSVNGFQASTGDTFDGQWGNGFGLGYNPSRDGIRFSLTNEKLECRDRLIYKIINDIQSNRTNLAEVLATMAQASNMVIDTAKRLADSFNKLKSGNYGGALSSLFGAGGSRGGNSGGGGSGGNGGGRGGNISNSAGGVPGQWLALQYGWKPLIGTVYDSIQAVHRAFNDDGITIKTKLCKAKVIAPPRDYDLEYVDAWGPKIRYSCRSRSVSGQGQMEYGITSMFQHNLTQFGILNPASLAWELLPYSFVVDWFLPIGPYLDALDYQRGLYFKSGWMTFKHKQSWQSRLVRKTGHMADYTATWSGGTGTGEAFYLEREALGSFPAVPFPRLKNPVSSAHVANALSLLSQAFS